MKKVRWITGTLVAGFLTAAMLLNILAAPQAAAPQQPQAPSGADAAGLGQPTGAKPAPPPPPPAVMPPPVTPIVSMTAPSPDPRVGLKAGRWDAGQAAWNMKMVSTTPPSEASAGSTHSDLAFSGKYAIQGNYNGFEICDISNPAKPVLDPSASIFTFTRGSVLRSASAQAGISAAPIVSEPLTTISPPRGVARIGTENVIHDSTGLPACSAG